MRSPEEPVSIVGKFIQTHLRQLKMSQSVFVKRIQIRYERLLLLYRDDQNADHCWLYKNFKQVVKVLALTPDEIQAYIKHLEAMFGELFLEEVSYISHFPVKTEFHNISSSVYEELFSHMEITLKEGGNLKHAHDSLQRQIDLLAHSRPNRDSEEFDTMTIRGFLLFAAIQEAYLPWGKQRPRITTKTYDRLEKLVFRPKLDKQRKLSSDFASHYAHLILRRAVLYREGDWAEGCEEDLSEAHDVRRFVLDCGDPYVRIAFDTQLAHTYAVKGEFAKWERAVEAIRRRIDRMSFISATTRKELHHIVDYTMGVGHKRFMWELRDADDRHREREMHARQSVQWLESLCNAQGEKSARDINLYHSSISDEQSRLELEASLIDSLVWYDPEAASQRAQALKQSAEKRFPTIIRKLDLNIDLAEILLDKRKKMRSPGLFFVPEITGSNAFSALVVSTALEQNINEHLMPFT